MARKYNWQYDEMKHSGVDYNNLAQVEVYDKNHQKFRNYQRDTEFIIQALGLGTEHTVIDMGAGTGAFAIHAAKFCKTIYAVDVSKTMLDYTRQKAVEAGIDNIVFCHGGFLTYEHKADPADAMVCVAVLHHLPDFWKYVGLRRSAQMLKTGGKLCLFDVVFPSDMADYESRFDAWVEANVRKLGSDFASEVEIHIRDEHSTFDWVMQGFLERAGFRIENTSHADGFGVTYICTKQ
jgi:putative AdoMet-dependent methyltransferase